MAEPIRNVDTSKYQKEGKVSIDGNIWTIKMPGAGTEFRVSQLEKEARLCDARLKTLEKAIDSGKYTDSDLDRYEELSRLSERLNSESNEIFYRMLSDGTSDNASVKNWIDSTPRVYIFAVFNELKESSEDVALKQVSEEADGQREPTVST